MMDVAELRKMCEDTEVIYLRMPGRNERCRRRLCGQRGPLGIVIHETAEYQSVQFDAEAVLRYLDKQKGEK